LRRGDVLLRYAGASLESIDDLGKAIAAHDGGKKEVELSVWREGKEMALSAAAGKLGVVLAKGPAPRVLAQRRQEQKQLALARSADDGSDWQELPGTRVEAEGLRRLFRRHKQQTTLLLGSDASELRLDRLARAGALKDYRYLHLATHGELDARGLLRSRLILSRDSLPDANRQMDRGEPIYDGSLTAAEVLLSWKLDCELVVLSACQTALGKYAVGESYIGFPQALLLAGSRSVCVSLWKVNDTATALLMTRFYENLLGSRQGLKGPLPRAEALREAKEWLRGLNHAEAVRLAALATQGVERGPRPPRPPTPKGQKAKVGDGTDRPYAHPYYWAAFVLIGDPS
jgi:CHAT domain-containing protein